MSDFLKNLFSASNSASFSRAGSFIALLCSCVWVSYIVWHTKALPSFEGMTFFIVSLYGVGKAGETIQNAAGKN